MPTSEPHLPSAPKVSKRGRKTRPIRWLREASPEEIGEALLTVDPMKTSQVMAYVMGRAGPELAARADAIAGRVKADPARAILGAFGALLRNT